MVVISLIIVAPFSFCSDKNENKIKRKYTIKIQNGTAFDKKFSEIQCDSFNMKSMNECIIYENGFSSKIFGEVISPNTNN